MILSTPHVGDTLFFRHSQEITSGTVEAVFSDSSGVAVETVRLRYETPTANGTVVIAIEDCYKTREACQSGLNLRSKMTVKTYAENIKTVDDLVNFCLTYPVALSEDTNYDAREAAIIRATKLGIKLKL